jgi:TolB-like protein/Flp pilus assembly protein TadD
MPTSTPETIPRTIAGRYVVDSEVGRGGMAVVYRAQDTRHGREVAVKILHRELAATIGTDRFLQEIRTAARLNHPHIVPLHDSGESDGLLYYVMPFIGGQTVRQRLQRAGRIPADEAVLITRQVAGALDYAHRLGIVHRDIKPENVMLYEGEALVTDFGIAKALTVAGGENLTRTGTALGTPAYMSPEQAAGDEELDARSDQYSLACVLYEMLTGEPPFTGPTAQAVIAKRFAETPRPVTTAVGVSDSVGRAVMRALEREPNARFTTTAEFASALATPGGTRTAARNGRRSIAVLPFANMSADPDNEYFTDGIAEEIINALTKVQALDVASRTSAFAFKGRSEDMREIGRKLGVGTVLEGSVRKAGTRLRITAQLVDVDSGYHLWSERYDRELADVFAIQDEIAGNIVKALRVVLTPAEADAIKATPASDVRAYEFYLRGRQLFHQHRKAAHRQAIEWYQKAIELDPRYALAYAGIADSSSFLYMYREATAANLQAAEEASRRALQLDPNLAEAHAAYGLAVSLRNKWDDAAASFERALELDPRSFEAAYFYGRASLARGDFEKAEEMFGRAAESRPDDYQAVGFQAMALHKLGRVEEALAAHSREVAAAERRIEINPGEARALYLGATGLMQLGQRERALDWANRAIATDPDEVSTLYNVGCLHSVAGEQDRALDYLERAIQLGFAHREWIEHDSDWDPLRSNPRFVRILESVKAAE